MTALLLVAQLHAFASAQEVETKRLAFTLHSRVTTNMDDGSKRELKEIRYVSSNGNFRAVYTMEDGSAFPREKVYEQGRGLYTVHHGFKMLVKEKTNLPETATTPPPTPAQLQASPRFVRTEMVLGRTAYLHRLKNEKSGEPEVDYYFAPELGWVPLKTVEYAKGKVFSVTEPVSIAFGEPDPAALPKLPDYEVEEMMPISGGVLNNKAKHRPKPAYPPAAKAAGIGGVVAVQVLLNEDGTVKVAKASFGHELLRAAAVEAALKARFSPMLLSGKPVKVAGIITYNFVLQ